MAICAVITGILGGGFFLLWYATLAWISATPVSDERLSEVRLLAWGALAGMGACLAIGIAGFVSLLRAR